MLEPRPFTMLSIDLTGKRAFVAGVADDGGFGFAIAKALAEAGATVCRRHLAARARHLPDAARARQARRVARMSDGEQARRSRRSIRSTPSSIDARGHARGACARASATATSATSRSTGSPTRLKADFGDRPLDIVVHSLANGPEVKKPLLETSRKGYLGARRRRAPTRWSRWCSASGRSCATGGSFLSLIYMASERVDPRLRRRHVVGEGGARERHAHPRVRGRAASGAIRVNVISAGPLRVARRERDRLHRRDDRLLQRNSPLPEAITADEVGATRGVPVRARSRSGITGTTVYVDKGYHAMGKALRPVDRII